MKNAFLLAMLALAVAACGSTEVKRADSSAAAAPPPQSAAPSPASRASPAASAPIAANPLKDPGSVLSKRSVFFAFDDNAVNAEDQKLLQAHGRYLGENRSVKIRIEGNCDERGSREYNLALGQRRAQAAKNVLKVVGVDDARVETISFGEDKPQAMGHDEASWARNRRADIKYPGE